MSVSLKPLPLFAKIALILCLLTFIFPASAGERPPQEEKRYFFYRPQIDYGSERTFNPLSLVLNGSFDILRNGNMSPIVYRQPYVSAAENVIDNLVHPTRHIKRYGTREFLRDEVFNLSFDPDHMQFLPNYTLHLVGNGMQWVKLAEWYDAHGYPYPRLLSLITTLGYQFLNETVENNDYRGSNVDPIADMLIFNPLSFLLFSTEFGKKFFSETLPVDDWSGQPFFNPVSGRMENAGQQYVIKLRRRYGQRIGAFFYFGVQSVVGISLPLKEEVDLSLGGGAVSWRLIDHRDGPARVVTTETKGVLSLFLDKNRSLLASAVISPDGRYVRLEAFPGWIGRGGFKPGAFVGRNRDGRFHFGLSVGFLPAGLLID